jgi:ABC-type amino acid transport substrate-binding protein
MIKTAITLAMLLCATAAHAQTVIEKLCIVTAAQDLPRVPGLEIKASRITVAPAEYLGNQDMKYFGAEIDVVAAGQSMTFAFACGTSPRQQLFTRSIGIVR